MVIRGDSPKLPLENYAVAARLDEVADILAAQNANPFRIRSYQKAAQLVRRLSEPLYEIINKEGTAGLEHLPGIGHALANSIEKLTFTGRLGLLDRLHGHGTTEHLLATVPGIGPGLAKQIHDQLGIDTLQDLEIAAADGRLAQVAGMGDKRLRGVRDSLAGRFMHRPVFTTKRSKLDTKLNEPNVAELLDVDDEYRRKAKSGDLPLIAPKLFNPTGQAWLPVLHTARGDRHYTALFSNTARAHELGTTGDWVVIYRDDKDGDGQWTVVTAIFGKNMGRRLVRGREQNCAEFYLLEKVKGRPVADLNVTYKD